MILVKYKTDGGKESAPRTCGDDPLGVKGGAWDSMCSPHLRG